VRDLRSVRVQDLLRAKWRDEIKRKPPAEREQWLMSQEAIVALGAKVRQDLLKELRRRRDRVRDLVPGGAWLAAWDYGQKLQPLVSFNTKGSLVPHAQGADGRKYSVRLQLSREQVKSGLGEYGYTGATVGTRRLTPPQCVEMEDFIDAMSPDQAAWWTITAEDSPSAVVIARIAAAKAKPVGGNW
jgi:hypothetical protein